MNLLDQNEADFFNLLKERDHASKEKNQQKEKVSYRTREDESLP